nr:AraC family transcriptional regulator ligand-binding domain-containing protein [Oceanococcus sp. HetDA_MAG_MS8]
MLETDPRFYVSLSYVRPIFDYLRQRGEDLSPYLECFGINRKELGNTDRLVKASGIDEVFALAEQRLEDAYIGLHVARNTQFQNLGTLGVLIMSCQYAREIFELHNRYQMLVGNPLYTEYRLEAEHAVLETKPVKGFPGFSRHGYDFIIGGWWHIKQSLVGNSYMPQGIQLPYSQPADAQPLESFYGVPLSFGHVTLRVLFDAHFWDLELMPADPEIKTFLEALAKQRLNRLQTLQTDANPDLARLKKFIADRLVSGVPNIESVAEDLGVSARTVQRQLDDLQTSYRSLLEQVRTDLARKHMANSDLSLLDVAIMLGFSEQSAFQRAFKRWFGCTPGEYRKQLKIE